MAADRFSLFYCLTHSGYFPVAEGEIMEGWILIFEVDVYQGSPFGRESRSWRLLRTNPDWDSRQADSLEGRFARPSRSGQLSDDAIRRLSERR